MIPSTGDVLSHSQAFLRSRTFQGAVGSKRQLLRGLNNLQVYLFNLCQVVGFSKKKRQVYSDIPVISNRSGMTLDESGRKVLDQGDSRANKGLVS